MAELADAPDLGSGGFTVGVQVPSPAPTPKGRLMDSSVTDSFCYCYKGQIAVRRRLPLFGRDSRLQNRPPEGFAAETSPAPMPKGRLRIHPLPILWFCGGAVYYKKAVPPRSCKAAGRDSLELLLWRPQRGAEAISASWWEGSLPVKRRLRWGNAGCLFGGILGCRALRSRPWRDGLGVGKKTALAVYARYTALAIGT